MVCCLLYNFLVMMIKLVKKLMLLYPNRPLLDDFALWEVFRHHSYVSGSIEEQNKIKYSSSKCAYDYENEINFFDKYFPNFSTEELNQKTILDLGCFTGGRVVNWAEKYGTSSADGIDINPIFAESGAIFAKKKGVNANFATGFGENLPYESNSFDFIISFDVLEHVEDVERVINECFRVLKPNGKLLAVFPQFFQPLEAHLGAVTKMPALHWFFSGNTITKAYNEIISERGSEADWYAPENPKLSHWEKLPSLNGITVNKFKKIISKNKGWNYDYWGRNPILSDGRKSKMLIFRILRLIFILPARLPFLQEFFLGRVVCILKKNSNNKSTTNKIMG